MTADETNKRHRLAALGVRAASNVNQLPVLVRIVAEADMHEFVRRWRKSAMWSFSFESAESALRGIAICFVDDLTTVHYVSFANAPTVCDTFTAPFQSASSVAPHQEFLNFAPVIARVFAARDRSNRVACKVTHPIRDAMVALTKLAPALVDDGGLLDPVAELHSRDRRSGVALHYAADRAVPRRGLGVDASNLPPFEAAVVRAVQSAAVMHSSMLTDVTSALCVASRAGALLALVEQRGIAVDRARLDHLLRRAQALSQQCERHALAIAQVGDLVALRGVVLARGGRLSLATLERSQHPAATWWARSRRIESLIRHGEALLAHVQPDGVVHCRFDGAHHENGRINSIDPNLQCLPKALCVLVPNRGSQDDERLALRWCVVARPNCVFVSADFRQMELRLVAALSGESKLLTSANVGVDAFVRIAALCGARTTRAQAKEVFYAALYGAGASSIARTLSCETERATAVLAELRTTFPALFAWRERVVLECRAAGNAIASPVYGSKRHIGELSSSDVSERAAAERRVVNGLVQSMAAEIFVTAMVNVQSSIRQLGAHVVLPLHDELLVEVARTDAQAVVEAMRQHMQIQVSEKQPPLDIFVRIGENWDEMSTI